MRLSSLLQPVSPTRVLGIGVTNGGVLSDPEITSVHCRADEVRPGGVFVAVSGNKNDGHDFISEALDNGAVAIVSERSVSHSTIVAQVADARIALAVLSARFYGNPADKLFTIGVTGTNGKTTTVGLVESILDRSGISVGVIGTGNYRYAGQVFDNALTTPAATDLQMILADMVAAGVTHVIMEVSSHALAQKRVAGCRFNIGVFTNLTQDHLDYHGDMAAYGACKKLLFTEYLKRGAARDKIAAVINGNDATGRQLLQDLRSMDRFSVGETSQFSVYPQSVEYVPGGITGTIVAPVGQIRLSSPLPGRFNLENILCAVGVASVLELPIDIISDGLQAFTGIPGRLESVANPLRRFVFVDYAHTPDALSKVLATLREITPGRLLCVFGCGGDRDRTKRAAMGKAVAAGADVMIVTSDNPRGEDPETIIREIIAGVNGSWAAVSNREALGKETTSRRFLVEPDRRQAIRAAVFASNPQDTILIAGKGNEPYQIIGDKTIAFDDRVAAAEALNALENEILAVVRTTL